MLINSARVLRTCSIILLSDGVSVLSFFIYFHLTQWLSWQLTPTARAAGCGLCQDSKRAGAIVSCFTGPDAEEPGFNQYSGKGCKQLNPPRQSLFHLCLSICSFIYLKDRLGNSQRSLICWLILPNSHTADQRRPETPSGSPTRMAVTQEHGPSSVTFPTILAGSRKSRQDLKQAVSNRMQTWQVTIPAMLLPHLFIFPPKSQI